MIQDAKNNYTIPNTGNPVGILTGMWDKSGCVYDKKFWRFWHSYCENLVPIMDYKARSIDKGGEEKSGGVIDQDQIKRMKEYMVVASDFFNGLPKRMEFEVAKDAGLLCAMDEVILLELKRSESVDPEKIRYRISGKQELQGGSMLVRVVLCEWENFLQKSEENAGSAAAV